MSAAKHRRRPHHVSTPLRAWAPDGRATFHYGEPGQDGEPYVVWRRIGTHSIFGRP